MSLWFLKYCFLQKLLMLYGVKICHYRVFCLSCLLICGFWFYILHISEIIWFLTFSVWLILLSMILSRSIHAMLWQMAILHFYLTNILLHICTTFSLSNHVSKDTSVGRRQQDEGYQNKRGEIAKSKGVKNMVMDRIWLWVESTHCIIKMVIALYTWNLYNFIHHYNSDKFNLKRYLAKILNLKNSAKPKI